MHAIKVFSTGTPTCSRGVSSSSCGLGRGDPVTTKFLSVPLTKEQISELVQMKNPPKP